MKVAVCLSGEPRDFHYIWNDFLQKINTNAVDFYVHTWHTHCHTSQLPSHNQRPANYQGMLINIPSSEYIPLVQPKDFLVEDFFKSNPYLRFAPYTVPSTITRMYSMYYGIQASIGLANQDNYDYIIRTRPDVFLEAPLDWANINTHFDAHPTSILIPELWFNIGGLSESWSVNTGQCPDFFCIYKSSTKIFNDVYDCIPQFCGLHTNRSIRDFGNLPSIPEDYLLSYLISKNVDIEKMSIKMMLARHHRQIVNKEQIL